MAKSVSKKFENIMEHEIVKAIVDKTSNITPIIEEVKSWWGYDLFNRKPGPAYTDDGVFVGTDLDLACFLYELSQRGAAINIPKYKTFRQKKFKEGQNLVSKENRHGVLNALISNQETWVFSIRIIDQNIMLTDGTGDYRTFSLTDFEGNWYEGWEKLDFIGTAKENQWLYENKLFTDNKIIFKHFIHPNRWISFYGEKYFITKLLLQRMKEEASHYFQQTKRMVNDGIKFPSSGGPTPSKSYTNSSVDEGKQIKVNVFEVELDVPPNESKFPEYDSTQENLLLLHKLRNNFVYGIGQSLRFMSRATEFAHFKNPDRFPGWIKGAEWVHNYKQKGKRKEWSRLVLCQPEYFKTGVAIRKRTFEKSTRVSEDYEG